MRENMGLYRGKRKDNGEWVEGYLLRPNPEVCRAYEVNDCVIGYQVSFEEGYRFYEVVPETVGQYIGLPDKNGVKVFEGDIVKHTPRPNCVIIYVVIFQQEYSRFSLVQWYTHKYQLYNWAHHDSVKYSCEVIGNIHDNPELLEVSK